MLKKRVLLIGILLGLIITSSLLYAKEPPKVNYTWTKIGDGFYELWDLHEPLFVENVENYNRAMLAKARAAGEKVSSWESIKPFRERLGLRISNVKYRDANGLIKVSDNKIFFRKLTYGNGKELYIKGIRDWNKVRIGKEDNTGSPLIYASKNNNYFIFTDEEGIWGVMPVIKDTVSFEVVKLTNDKVNDKTQYEIRRNFKENQILLWNEHPRVSSNGSYVAYLSNKDGYSKNNNSDQAFFELWIIDTKQNKDTIKFSESSVNNLTIYDWADDYELIFSVNDNIYLFNAKDNSRTLLLKDVVLLNYRENIFTYFKNCDSDRMYFYNYKTHKETSSIILPQETLFTAKFLSNYYSTSSNGSRLAVRVCEMNADNPTGKTMIYLLNNSTNSLLKIDWPEGARGGSLGKWLNNNELVLNTLKYSNGMEIIITWILSFNE